MGGLGFFFFGMKTMSEGLKKVAGERLKGFLHMVTNVPVVGVLVGTLVTCLIQSSSATTVMVVGFVNAGLLSLKQAISVIIGANIGTTFTAWLVSSMSVLNVTKYAMPLVGIGFAMTALGVNRKRKFWGEVLLGFGMLFIGLGLLKDAFGPWKDSEQIKNIFVVFSQSPLLGVLVGTVFTVLLQSSSVTVAIIQVLAFNGLITFDAAVPLILGDNIGTTITAQLAAIGTNYNARRAAMSHTLFNLIGVSYIIVFVYFGWYQRFIDFIIPGAITLKNVMFYIAVSHSCFNIVNAIVFLPMIPVLEKISIWAVPKKKGAEDIGPQYLEKHLLDTPPLAMQQVKSEIVYMLTVAHKAVNAAIQGFMGNDEALLNKALSYEKATDNLQSEITQYVIDLSQRQLNPEESQGIPVLIHYVNDIERMGDHAKNIAELTHSKIDMEIRFSDVAVEELGVINGKLEELLSGTENTLIKQDVKRATDLLDVENKINELQIKLKESHICRMNQGVCDIKANFIFLDFIDNIEKIADHLTNINQGIIGRMQWRAYAKDRPLAHPQ
ncbi:MAG: Na/Pi cotransporter family protein [Candidatus Omnitrophota bacterium]